MAVTKTLSNKFKLELGKGTINFSSDAFRVILMEADDTFDRTADLTYGDGTGTTVASRELATGNGYTQLTKALVTDSAWAQDDINHKASIAWEDVTWTASTGSIGPTAAAIVLQHDSVTPADSLVVGCIDFGENITITDGVSFQLQDLGFDLEQGA